MIPVYFSVIVCTVFVMGAFIHNTLVVKRNAVDNALFAIDTQLKRRDNLISLLVTMVRDHAGPEQQSLDELIRLHATTTTNRSRPLSDARIELDIAISHHMRLLMEHAEQVPRLCASANFVELQHTLDDVTAQISSTRRGYNTAVSEYNAAVTTLPGVLLARPFGFVRRAMLSIPEQERRNVGVTRINHP